MKFFNSRILPEIAGILCVPRDLCCKTTAKRTNRSAAEPQTNFFSATLCVVSTQILFLRRFSLRPSAYLRSLCGNAYFTAESQRYAEERREEICLRLCFAAYLSALCESNQKRAPSSIGFDPESRQWRQVQQNNGGFGFQIADHILLASPKFFSIGVQNDFVAAIAR
jgi:hypothetical protein